MQSSFQELGRYGERDAVPALEAWTVGGNERPGRRRPGEGKWSAQEEQSLAFVVCRLSSTCFSIVFIQIQATQQVLLSSFY